MSALDLDAIKARCKDLETRGHLTRLSLENTVIRDDVPALVAEVERLRGEVESITFAYDQLKSDADAEVGRLTVPATAPPSHFCQWCEINTNHPKCPTNADYLDACPHCGSDPEDVTLHTSTCPTLGTCASTYPDLPKPWHPEPESNADWRAWHDEHMRTAHVRFLCVTAEPHGVSRRPCEKCEQEAARQLAAAPASTATGGPRPIGAVDGGADLQKINRLGTSNPEAAVRAAATAQNTSMP